MTKNGKATEYLIQAVGDSDAVKQLSSDDPDKRLDAVKALGLSCACKRRRYRFSATYGPVKARRLWCSP